MAPKGAGNVGTLIGRLADAEEVPGIARGVLQTLVDQLRHTEERLAELDAQLAAQARRDETVQRLMSVPGVGPIVATALVATRSGRHLAAWIGLVPGQRSTGGKERLVGITKSGDGYLPSAAGQRRPRSHPLVAHTFRLAGRPADTPPGQRGRRGTSQQAGAHRLGGHGAR